MKKIGILLFIIMMMAVVTAAQAEVRAGGLPPLVVDDRISDGKAPAKAPVRAGGLPELVVDSRISDCANCETIVTIVLNVEFDSDKAIVKDKYRNEIKKVADFMKKYPNTTAVIEGHTDSTNTAAYNQKLSEARANSVRQYLINNFGIKASRLTAVGYGLTRPIASNSTEEGKQKNRRVQAVIKAMKKN
jgi:outer membrane protein OmpA-like peptidoglycan-associated protein